MEPLKTTKEKECKKCRKDSVHLEVFYHESKEWIITCLKCGHTTITKGVTKK